MSWSATCTCFLNTSSDGDSTTFLGSLLNSLQNSFSGRVFWEHKVKCHKESSSPFPTCCCKLQVLVEINRNFQSSLETMKIPCWSSYGSNINYISYYWHGFIINFICSIPYVHFSQFLLYPFHSSSLTQHPPCLSLQNDHFYHSIHTKRESKTCIFIFLII